MRWVVHHHQTRNGWNKTAGAISLPFIHFTFLYAIIVEPRVPVRVLVNIGKMCGRSAIASAAGVMVSHLSTFLFYTW